MTFDDDRFDDSFDRLRGVSSRPTTHEAPPRPSDEPEERNEPDEPDGPDEHDEVGELWEPDDTDIDDDHAAATDDSGSKSAGRDRRRRRRRTLLVLGIVLLPVVLVLCAGGWFLYELNPPGGPGKRVSVDIPPRTGTSGIGDLLTDKGVIGSSQAFQIYVGVTRAGPFQPGHYAMRENLGVRDAVSNLKSGPAKGPELVIPPGLTLSQIADRVGALKGHNRDAFLQVAQSGVVRSRYQPPDVTSLEGLLYPDTYFVAKDETDQQILTRLVSAFDRNADAIRLSAPNAAGLSPYQTIVAASLIEREAKLDEDRPLISAVIHNRLATGRLLQIDATVCYAKGGCDQSPTAADLAIDSPYNTYRNAGLPPTPISSVTVKSLEAAQNPAAVPYLYYVLIDKNGKHAFASTQEEHDRNVEEARKKGLL